MPSTVGRDLGRKFDRMGSELRRARSNAVRQGALALVGPVRDEIQRVTGDNRLSGVGRSGAQVGARFDLRGDDTAVIRATGPLHLVERDTKPHTIAPKGRRGRSGQAIRLADGSIRRSVQHPGTKGKAPFAKGIRRGRPDAVRVLRSVTVAAVRRGMRA